MDYESQLRCGRANGWDKYDQFWLNGYIRAFISADRKLGYYVMEPRKYVKTREDAEQLVKRMMKLESFT